MSYTITVRIYQTSSSAYFRVVEKTGWWGTHNGALWDERNGEHILSFSNSGTSGTIRLKDLESGQEVVVALGVHNYRRWCDTVPLAAGNDRDTGATVQASYYGGSRDAKREAQGSESTSSGENGRNFRVQYTVKDGNALKANIFIV